MASSTNEYARRSANRRMTRFCEETGNNRHSSRMTPLNMLLAEQAESDAVRRRSTLINMPIVAETSILHHSSDSGNNEANEVLTEEQIQAFQEAFALFDKVNTLTKSPKSRYFSEHCTFSLQTYFRTVVGLSTLPSCRKHLKSAKSM